MNFLMKENLQHYNLEIKIQTKQHVNRNETSKTGIHQNQEFVVHKSLVGLLGQKENLLI